MPRKESDSWGQKALGVPAYSPALWDFCLAFLSSPFYCLGRGKVFSREDKVGVTSVNNSLEISPIRCFSKHKALQVCHLICSPHVLGKEINVPKVTKSVTEEKGNHTFLCLIPTSSHHPS